MNDEAVHQAAAQEKFKEDLNTQQENAKAEQAKKDILNKQEKQKQLVITYSVSLVLLLVLLLVAFIYRGYRQKQKANVELSQKNETIAQQKHLVEEKQKEVVESITYAKRLQEAILPPKYFIDKYVENFIFYKPKDLVAGDFYWAERVGDLFFIAAADSTGHGVPGAMVSVVCSNALNRSIKEFNLTDTGRILEKTRDLVIETFEKSADDVKDGMDISLLCIDNKNKLITWSGANNPLWYVQDNTFIEIKADKQPIGKTDQLKPFTMHKIDYRQNSTFYLFTDGFADQFGGPNGKKFKYKPFSDLLVKNNHLSQLHLEQLLDKVFSDWKGNLEQVDDVCVIGIKIG